MRDAENRTVGGSDLIGSAVNNPRAHSRADASLAAAIKRSRELVQESTRILAHSRSAEHGFQSR